VTKTEPTPVPSYLKLQAKAAELRKSDSKLTEAQAFTKAYVDPANRGLVAQYKREEAAQREETMRKYAQNVVAPSQPSVGKGALYPSGQLASARLSDKASTLATVTGLDHPSCLARVRAAEPE
jgi:hypothetical protein